jgi:dihydrofolate reductase
MVSSHVPMALSTFYRRMLANHGYDEFIQGIDTIVIGRKTFETALSFTAWPYGKKRVVVLSSRPLDLSAVRGGAVEQVDDPSS